MSQPATAGIIVGLIFAIPLTLFLSWKGYVRYRKHKQLKLSEPLPPIREPSAIGYNNGTRDGYASGTIGSRGLESSMGFNSPNLTPFTWRNSVSKNSLGGSSIFNGLAESDINGSGNRSRRASSQGLVSPIGGGSLYGGYGLPPPIGGGNGGGSGASSTEAPASPLDPTSAVDSLEIPPESYDHSRGAGGMVGSSSSTMTLKRAYENSSNQIYHPKGLTSSSSSSNSPNTYDQSSIGRRRESYLPHSPLNRDSIQIVPPQPLGFGPLNGMATATDQRTLAFSKTSGVGVNEDWSTGLVWNTNGEELNRPSSAARVAEEQRLRYLMQGPTTNNSSLSAHPTSGYGSVNGSKPSSSRSRSPRSEGRSDSNSDYPGMKPSSSNSTSNSSSSFRNSSSNNPLPIPPSTSSSGESNLVKPVARHPLEAPGTADSSSSDGSQFNRSQINGKGNENSIGKLNKMHSKEEVMTSRQSPLQQWGDASGTGKTTTRKSSKDASLNGGFSPKKSNLNSNGNSNGYRPSSSGTTGTEGDGSPILSAFKVSISGTPSDFEEKRSGVEEMPSSRNRSMVLGKDGQMKMRDLDGDQGDQGGEKTENSKGKKGWGVTSLFG